MTHLLTVELNDQIFTAIQREAQAIGIPPERLAATFLEQRFGQVFKLLLSESEKEIARARFERHFGALNLEHTIDLNNESIDVDLLKEYGSNHEES